MREDWKTYKLPELGTIARGKSKHRPRDASHLYGGEYPFIQTGDVKVSNHRLNQHTQTYSEDGLAQSKLWPKNTMCITIAANIAETAILDYPACFPDSIIGFIADETLCDIDFAEYLMQYFKKQIQSHSIGSVQENINLGTFQRVEFKVPPLTEQKQIASILSALDDKIELNLQMNKTLEEMAMALYKHWFVDFGPFQEGEFVDSELGLIPEGWEVKRLDSLVNFSNGYAFKSKQLLKNTEDDCFHVFKMGHIQKGGGLKANGTKSWVRKNDCTGLDKYILKVGDILMSMTDMKDNMTILGHTALMNENQKYIVNQRVGLLRINNKVNVGYPFIFMLTNSFDYIERLRSQANSGVQVNLSTDAIKSSKVVTPTESINEKFHQITLPLFEQINKNAIENQTLTQLRDTLLPKLISGEVRVKEVQEMVSEALVG
ncbi:restriction endonuclease subunit S [Ancylomarina euxinus]|uniref:Restriction endonuclease subunit S n=1 Tax=Ancylomarina euxinus TaxID=2283627 RepID=A0A425Y427_9BACT|nr:restriction endonuclease subunit S [Ancylomarina euxinus]MCZ4694585.1 restriction endonuclease subunit S [Ancylomarina euxinus]MUP14128.1 restriction endonuclease subunit S [Ancylomarina euxinus]RRG22982.1 restriction endonuclease subunit S [Ancylomarina euxinus]